MRRTIISFGRGFVSPRFNRVHSWIAALSLIAFGVTPASVSAQGAPDVVGEIEGSDIAVKSPLSMEASNGRIVATLANGSEVTVRSGQAHLTFTDGGELDICGPAQFSTLKSNGALTLALDYGRVHARLPGQGGFSIFSPLIVATPIGIGEAPREFTLGLDADATICIVTTRGALRMEQQLTGESLLVPQSGDIRLDRGDLHSVRTASVPCVCDPLEASRQFTPPNSTELSALARPAPAPASKATGNSNSPAKPELSKDPGSPPIVAEGPAVRGRTGPPATEEPIYKVLMPPLTFDAKSPAPPPDPDPQTILLLRSVRVRPSVIFHGQVAPLPLAAVTPAPPVQVAQVIAPRIEEPPKAAPGVFSRMWNALKRTFSSSPGH